MVAYSLLSMQCLAQVRNCLSLLVRVVDWCVSLLVRLICCWIFLTASSPGTKEAVDLPFTCQPSPGLTTFAFRLRKVRHLLLDLDPCGDTDPLSRFPLLLKRTAHVMANCPSAVFWQLACLGNFLACWRQANVTPIPNGQPSSSVANYQPSSLTLVLSKVFECLVSVRLGWFMERSGVLPITQFAYRKSLYLWCTFVHVPYTLQSALESLQKARIM